MLDLKRIFLNENEELSVSLTVGLSELNSVGTLRFTTPAQVQLTVSNHAGLVMLDEKAEGGYSCLCDRCASEISRRYAYRFQHIIVRKLSEDSDCDTIEAPDYMLDPDALLRDDILLELPSKFLCKDSCKGLCPKCGKNLNEGRCDCPEHEPDPRLAALSALLKD